MGQSPTIPTSEYTDRELMRRWKRWKVSNVLECQGGWGEGTYLTGNGISQLPSRTTEPGRISGEVERKIKKEKKFDRRPACSQQLSKCVDCRRKCSIGLASHLPTSRQWKPSVTPTAPASTPSPATMLGLTGRICGRVDTQRSAVVSSGC